MSDLEFQAPDWKEVALGDVCTFRGGNGFKEQYQGQASGDHPFIKVSDLTLPGNEKYVTRANNWVSAAVLKSLGTTLQPQGAVVFAKVGAALKLNRRRILSRPTAIDNNMMVAIPNPERIDGEFLYYFMLVQDLGRFSQESAVPSVNQGHLASIDIGLPALKEQREIAQILRTWDEAIHEASAIVELRQSQYLGIRDQLIDWRNGPRSSLRSLVNPVGRPVPRPTEPYLALSIRSHGKGTFVRQVADPSSVDMDTLFVARAGDLIVNITFAWEGAIALVPQDHDGCLVSHRFPTFVPNARAANARYLRHALRMPRFTYLLGLVSPGGAGRNRVLNKSDFLDLEVPSPELSRQEAVAFALDAAEEVIAKAAEYRDALTRQKRGLMQKLLTGEWRVAAEERAA